MGGYHFTCTARLPWIVQAPWRQIMGATTTRVSVSEL
jgi:hypothetical protein